MGETPWSGVVAYHRPRPAGQKIEDEDDDEYEDESLPG